MTKLGDLIIIAIIMMMPNAILLIYSFLISHVSQMVLYHFPVWNNIEKLVVLLDLIFQ